MGAEPSERLKNRVPEGWMPLSHAEVIQSTEGMELVGLCDMDETRREKFGKYYHVDHVYSDYKEMIDELQPDIISIATRTDIRCDIINYALQKGVRGFYAEKPLARSIKESRETLEHIEACGAKIVYGATRRAMEVYKKAKEICFSEELGSVTHISIEFGHSALLWTLPHAADLIVFFANSTEFDFLQAYSSSIPDSGLLNNNILDMDPIIDFAYFKMSNGISAAISPVNGLNVRIGCTKGIVTVHGNGEFIEINRAGKTPNYFNDTEILKTETEKSGTQYLFSDLRDAILNNKSPQNISPDEILCSQKMLFGMAQSAIQHNKILYSQELNEELVVTGKTGALFA
jgi:predicted dehydrogenase